jgi:two-component system sensor histidine kinase/response regulator
MGAGSNWTRDYSTEPLNLNVLVVEDDESNRLVADGVLKLFHCEVAHAASGTAAVELALSGKFDVVLMDYHLPGMDGVAATRAIRQFEAEHGRAAVPIIGLTGSAMAAERQECLASGMNSILPKPFRFAELRAALEEWGPDKRDAAQPLNGAAPSAGLPKGGPPGGQPSPR